MGHWEVDSVLGSTQKQALLILLRRKSGFALLYKVSNWTADLVGWTIESKSKPLISRVKSLAVDNGKEFVDHQAINQSLGIQTYFADPYCSWECGSNEHFNGLLRQDFRKEIESLAQKAAGIP